ncbi:MAG: VIT domain-containing protein [Chloroflexota bacterium]|nr:VIT domain-containing protein [Chloroflexota bacterium]
MNRLLAVLSVLVLAFALVMPAAAQECMPCPPDSVCTMECRPWIGGVSTNPEWLKIDHHRVRVEIADQIARTQVSMEFVNDGNGLAEGTFLFPLPVGASVEELIMYINGDPIIAQILEADEARAIYDEIVRQYRDPALLEYVGMGVVQANVFPIPPGESRRIEITYSQVLEVDNGLIHYVYPFDVSRLTTFRPVEEASISINVISNDPIGSIYSPSHDIAIDRDGDEAFSVGFEQNFYSPDQDFSLYYGVASETISVNLLTYRDSASEDGFFMLLVQPPLDIPDEQIIPRDIIVVLDQSGSMQGAKWDQAREAAGYVLDNLNSRDRFNVVLFSTGWRVFSNDMEDPRVADEAIQWIDGMFAEGGTDINGALTTALEMADDERPTTILFLTDGLPTEGETNVENIIDNLETRTRPNIRIFSFGVGDDVETFLLDTIARDFQGTSSYVRPTERIDEEVASLYNKISAPVLRNIDIDIDGVTVDSIYPELPLPDLFAGTQLTIVGRYRGSADEIDVTLSGLIGDDRETFVYDGFDFRARAGGEGFIPRLWATRRIGELLNSIRLNGENAELIDSIVALSVRYGIITPYTSFLIEEDDILTQQGRRDAAARMSGEMAQAAGATSGADAVSMADTFSGLASANAAPMMMATAPATRGVPGAPPVDTGAMGGTLDDQAPQEAQMEAEQSPLQTVNGKTFLLQDGVWTDTTFDTETMETEKVVFLSDAYFDLLTTTPDLVDYFALGERVIVVYDDVAYEVTAE